MASRDSLDARPLRARDVPAWDDESGVVVVGSGCAGVSAALGALEAGAEVLVLEAAGGLGGTSIVSSGQLYLGGGTRVQRACGFEDTPEEMFEYLMASCGPAPDAALVAPFCEQSVDHFEWLVARGVPFKNSFFDGAHEPPGDEGLTYSGSEHLHPYRDLAKPAPRGHSPQVAGPKGRLLMSTLLASARTAGQREVINAACQSLVLESDGRVAGVAARIDGNLRYIRARSGVVLASGGFIFDDDMLSRYAPRAAKCLKLGAGRDDGSGIRMGMAAGAETIRMEAVDITLTLFPPTPIRPGIIFDRRGARCINEAAYAGSLGEECLLRQDGRLFLLLDDETLTDPAFCDGRYLAVGNSIQEIEAELSLPASSLELTLRLYNGYAEAGLDPMFHKDAEYLVPLASPPYVVVDLSAEAVHYAALTLGGFQIDPAGKVLQHGGEALPGLFAAGRTTSAIAKQGYSSGISLADASFFGRRAGRAAARG